MLSDVGVAGQAAIARAVARVEGVAVAERYALRTGFEGVAPGTLDVEALAPHPIVRHDAPRALLASARAVLTEVRRCLRETKP